MVVSSMPRISQIVSTSRALPALPTLKPDDPLYDTAQAARQYVRAAKSAATRRAYNSDWKHYVVWCQEHDLVFLPAEPATIVYYITALAEMGRKRSTITRRLTSITTAHKKAGFDSPAHMKNAVVADTMQGIRHTLRLVASLSVLSSGPG
jgi:site-specific recombinase XerD